MQAYVKRRLRDGFTQEFFVEGGRSRTGKLLPPKLGMLTLEVEAWLTGVRPDAYFVPISISYEKIAEARSYQHELLGGEKQKEDAKALLSATKVLRSRLGRITIRGGDPISLAQLLDERGVDPRNHTHEDRRALVRALGLRVAAGINRATPLAPIGLVSAILLSHDRRGMSEEDVLERAEFLHQAALDAGARTPAWQMGSAGPGLPPASLRHSGLVERALSRLGTDGHLKLQEAGGLGRDRRARGAAHRTARQAGVVAAGARPRPRGVARGAGPPDRVALQGDVGKRARHAARARRGSRSAARPDARVPQPGQAHRA